MMIQRHPDTTRTLGKSQGYFGLPIVDLKLEDGTAAMVSVWEPTPAELEMLNKGGKVNLTVLGTAHPPVYIGVSNPEAPTAQG